MEPGFQLHNFEDSPRNFLPAGLFLDGANGGYMFPMRNPLSPMNGSGAKTPFQIPSRNDRGQTTPFQIKTNQSAVIDEMLSSWRDLVTLPTESADSSQLMTSPRRGLLSPRSPQWQPLNTQAPTLDNIENFEPGSPHWNDSVPAYPHTPNFKQWLKDDRMTPKKHTATNKLGPERYKSLRVSGKSGGKSAHESQTSKRGEKLGTFYDPGFKTMDKASFRTASNGGKQAARFPAARAWTVGNTAQKAWTVGNTNQHNSKKAWTVDNTTKKHTEKKQSLYKTELCTNWTLTNNCTYGNKCHFAHGIDDLKPRTRLENFKTQPCCDPAREGSRRCLYGSRCNYCHPGEAIRRPVGHTYYDANYYKDLQKDFGDNRYPFGIYV